MKIDERALLQERVRTLVLRHALQAVLERLAAATRGAGQDVEAELLNLEQTLVATARGLADRASAQKLAVLVAVEDATATIRAAFDTTHDRLDLLAPPKLALVETPAAVAA
jgi:N-methylhydantoinase B/oxoprolinase/acetone carboxylase alpha subunit